MKPDDRPILSYEPVRPEKRSSRFPWGVTSLTLGMCAAVGVPIFDIVTRLPGFLQEPIMQTGIAAGLLAMFSGVIAYFFPDERLFGIMGGLFGFAALVLLPAFVRA